MDFVKRYPLLSAVLAFCVAAFAAELFFLWKFSSNATKFQAQLKTSQTSAKSAESQAPAPSNQNLDSATKNVDDLKAELDDVHKTLQDTPEKIVYVAPASNPGSSLILDILSYASDMQKEAQAKGVMLPSKNYSFGMALYCVEGAVPPPVDKIPSVYKQMKVLQYIVGHLIDDGKLPDQPLKIISVEREDVASVAVAAGSNAVPDLGGNSLELFAIDPMITARVPGAINTLAFRVKFIGYSESLRILLNDLAKFDLPLVVRSVEAEPAPSDQVRAITLAQTNAAAGSTDANSIPADTSTRKPVITENLSQFTLVIEYIELPAPPPSAQPAAEGAAASGTAPAAASGTAAATGSGTSS